MPPDGPSDDEAERIDLAVGMEDAASEILQMEERCAQDRAIAAVAAAGEVPPRLVELAVAVPLEEPVRRYSTGLVPIASDSEFSFDTASSAPHSGVDTMSPCTPTADGDGTVSAQAEPSDPKRKKHGKQAADQECYRETTVA